MDGSLTNETKLKRIVSNKSTAVDNAIKNRP